MLNDGQTQGILKCAHLIIPIDFFVDFQLICWLLKVIVGLSNGICGVFRTALVVKQVSSSDVVDCQIGAVGVLEAGIRWNIDL